MREALFGVGVREETQGVASLDDREDLQLAVLTDQVGDDGVSRLVGRDRALLVLAVLDRLLEPDLFGELRLLHVVPAGDHRARSA